MKIRKAISAFLAAICILTSVNLFALGTHAEGEGKSVTATAYDTLQQGSYGYCYVYIDDLTDLASLDVAVHYDPSKITVVNSYNSVACTMYDSSNNDGRLQFTYIFDGEGSDTQTLLFYFEYQANSDAAIGDSYFDIVIGDAYDTSLDPVSISGSRYSFKITEKTVTNSCSVYSSGTVSTSVKEEFTVSYSLSTYSVASGSFNIQYDPELFEVVEVTNGKFLDGKVADVNSSLDGSVAVSFAGTSYNYNYDLVTVKFRTLKNVAASSEIKLKVTDLYDLQLTPYSCSGCTQTVNVAFDESYTEDSPAMFLSAIYNEKDGKVTLTVGLEKDSCLGVGDFVINFDTDLLAYESFEKGFAPSFFNVNDKNAANGELKFSIISLSDIVDEHTVMTVVFDVKHADDDAVAAFEISGSGLFDSLTTKPRTLNFVGTEIEIPKGYILGDVNGDGGVTNADVLVIYRYIYNADLYPLNEKIGDVNGDGGVTNADVLMIYRYIYNPNLYPIE